MRGLLNWENLYKFLKEWKWKVIFDFEIKN